MIELEIQFQIIIVSVLFAMVFTNIYSFIEIMLSKSKVFRSILELCFFLSATVIYYYLMFILNKGRLSIYLPIALILGYYLHQKFYDKHFSCLYRYLFSKIDSIIKIKKDRCKKKWKELIKKKAKKAKSTG